MEFALIIIAVVVISIISAALKKKPKSSGEQNAPPRPTMTDIQRAFMMAAGMPDDEQNPPPRPATSYTRPAPGTYAPQYAPPVSPYAVPTTPYAQSASTPYAAEPYSGMPENSAARLSAVESANPYTATQISSYFMDEEDRDQILQAESVHRQQASASAGIPLFENQRDIVKALIYSEILPRRSGAQRRR